MSQASQKKEGAKEQQNSKERNASEGSDIYIGIDLGTTYTGICYYHSDQDKIFMCQNDGEDKFPSVVAVSREDGAFFVGTEAIDMYLDEPEVYALYTEFKRLMDSPEANKPLASRIPKQLQQPSSKKTSKKLTDPQVTPVELQSMVLQHALKLFEKKSQGYHFDIQNITISIPTGYSELAKENVRKAAMLAGITIDEERFSLVLEPVAAALSCRDDMKSLNKETGKMVIFDFGGGTLDLVLLEPKYDPEFGTTQLIPKIPGGDRLLGGKDFDRALLMYYINRINDKNKELYKHPVLQENQLITAGNTASGKPQKKTKKAKISKEVNKENDHQKDMLQQPVVDLSNCSYSQDLLEAAEVKRRLSRGSSAKFSELSEQNGTMPVCSIRIRATEQKKIYAVELTRVRKVLERYVSRLKEESISTADIDYVMLVGGSSHIPLVRSVVQEFFQEERIIQPQDGFSNAVMKGACLFSFDPDMIFGTVSGVTYGIALLQERKAGDLPTYFRDHYGESYTLKNVHSIRKGENIDERGITRYCNTFKDNQESLTFSVFQGDGEYPGINSRNVGELVLDFGRKVPKGTNITYIWKLNKRTQLLELTAFETHEPENKVQIHIDWTPESYEVIV